MLLQTGAECTGSKLSSKFVRSRYQVYSPYTTTRLTRNPNLNPNPNPNQVYSPYNDTEDENLVNKFADGEPGGAGVTNWWKSFTLFLPIPAC